MYRVLLVTALLSCSSGFGIDTVSPGYGIAMAGELTPVYPGYPEVFDVSGSIEYLENDTLVINDASFFLSPSATYHSPNGPAGRSAISQGRSVGILLTEDNIIQSVWILETRNTNQFNGEDRRNPERNTPYKKENGVWKN